MSLTQDNMVMPVAPMYGNNGGFGGFGGDWSAWIVLFLIFGMFNGGWGGMGGFGGNQLGYDFPWLINGQQQISNNTSNGFRDAMLNDGITSIRDGISNVQTQLCNGFAGVNATVNSVAANAETSANARQMANMNQIFGLSQQFADCCCENRLAACQTQNIIQNEGNATRFADANNTRDIIDATNRGNQMILDKLCQLELDGVKQNYENRIAGMQNVIDGLSAQVNAADRRVAMGEEVDALYNRLNSCPVPTTPVFGRTPIFQCNNGGCGCNGGFYN